MNTTRYDACFSTACRMTVLVCTVLFSDSPAYSQAKPKTGSRWALLVGVDDYAEAQKLHFCGADMLALRDHLISAGFPEQQVVVLHDKAQQTKYRPTKHNVQRQLELMLGLVAKDDLLVVGFSGHGIQIRGKSYLCPADTELNVPDSMVPLDRVYDQLDHCAAALKLVLVDACRNDPRQAGQKGVLPSEGVKQFAASLERPPKGILMLTSCAPGQISMEDQDFGHGVFMHFLLEGLEGKADAEGKGRVSLVDLYGYANRETKAYVMRKFNGTQTPALKGDLNDDFDIETGPSVPWLLNAALKAARYKADPTKTAAALASVAELQADSGDVHGALRTFEEALQLAGGLKAESRSHVLADIAKAQAQAGLVEQAVATVEQMPDKDEDTFIVIGAALARTAHATDAAAAFAAATDLAVKRVSSATEMNRASAAQRVIGALLHAQQFTQALRVADVVRGNDKGDAVNVFVLARCAAEQARNGDRDGSTQTLSRASEMASRLGGNLWWYAPYDRLAAAALARAGKAEASRRLFERCLQSARRETRTRALRFIDIARYQGYAHDTTGALATLRETLEMVKASSVSEPADIGSRVSNLATIGALQALAGDRQSSAATLREARNKLAGMSEGFQKIMPTFNLAGAESLAGDFVVAIHTAGPTTDGQTMCQTIETVLSELWRQDAAVEVRDAVYRAALRASQRIPDASSRIEAMRTVTFARSVDDLPRALKRRLAVSGVMACTLYHCLVRPGPRYFQAFALARDAHYSEAVASADDPAHQPYECQFYCGIVRGVLDARGIKCNLDLDRYDEWGDCFAGDLDYQKWVNY